MKKYLITSFILFFTLFSCNDFLEEKMNPALSIDYLLTEQGAIKEMNAIYSSMRYTYGIDRTIDFVVGGTDEYTIGSDKTPEIVNYVDINPTTPTFWQLWESWYLAINNCNILIDNLPKIPAKVIFIDENKRNILLGEALFMRAFYYYHLVLNYGSVPMPLKGNIGDITTEFTREPVSDIFSQIIADLRNAINYLPEADKQEFGRATKGAAQMLLSRAYLARVSVPDERMPDATDLDSVIYLTTQVIESNKYELLENYSDLCDGKNDNNKEIIFCVQYTPNLVFNSTGNTMHLYFLSSYESEPGMQRTVEGGRSWKQMMPTDYLMDLYDRKYDSRFYKSYRFSMGANNSNTIPKDASGNPKFSLGDTAFLYTMDWVNVDWNVIKTLNDYSNLLKQAKSKYIYSWHPRNDFSPAFEKEFRAKVSPSFALNRAYYLSLIKHLDFTRPNIQIVEGQNNLILIRFAEAYIMRAEAYGRKNNFADAVINLNVIRNRGAYKDGEVKPPQHWRTEGGIKDDLTGTYSKIKLTEADIQTGFGGTGDFIDFILDEMAREFNGECRRWMDLARFGRLVERVKKYNLDAGPYIKDYHKLRPIPSNHIERLIPKPPLPEVQNPGYY